MLYGLNPSTQVLEVRSDSLEATRQSLIRQVQEIEWDLKTPDEQELEILYLAAKKRMSV